LPPDRPAQMRPPSFRRVRPSRVALTRCRNRALCYSWLRESQGLPHCGGAKRTLSFHSKHVNRFGCDALAPTSKTMCSSAATTSRRSGVRTRTLKDRSFSPCNPLGTPTEITTITSKSQLSVHHGVSGDSLWKSRGGSIVGAAVSLAAFVEVLRGPELKNDLVRSLDSGAIAVRLNTI
jgi:hypothetical protein